MLLAAKDHAVAPNLDTVPDMRDRDRIFGQDFVKQVKAMGIRQVLSAPRSPWQRLRRASHRHDPARVPGPLDRVQRAKSVRAPPDIRGILSPEPCSLGIGERHSRTPTDPAPGVWADRLDTGAGRAASPIRAARRLSNSTTVVYRRKCCSFR